MGNQLEPYKQCYCQAGLFVHPHPPADHTVCRFCFKVIPSSDSVVYKCFNSQCFYLQTSDIDYRICMDCCNRETDVDDDNKTNDQDNGFIYNKLKSSLAAISYLNDL